MASTSNVQWSVVFLCSWFHYFSLMLFVTSYFLFFWRSSFLLKHWLKLCTFWSLGSTGSFQSHACPSHSLMPAVGHHTPHRPPTPSHGTIALPTTGKCLSPWSRFLHKGLSRRWWTPGTLNRVCPAWEHLGPLCSSKCPLNRNPETLALTQVSIAGLKAMKHSTITLYFKGTHGCEILPFALQLSLTSSFARSLFSICSVMAQCVM